MKTVILGIGNPLLGDDGAGWRVADQIRQLFTPNSELNIENCSLDGLSLMEKISGYDAAILIDTIYTGINKKGSVLTSNLSNVENASWTSAYSQHNMPISSALKLGRFLNIDLPDDSNVFIIAIEAEKLYKFEERLTPKVEKAIPVATSHVTEILNKITKSFSCGV